MKKLNCVRKAVLTDKDKVIIEALYVERHRSLGHIAKLLRKSRSTIYKVLKARGVDTSKGSACWVDLVCDSCEKPYKATRSKYHKSARHFCSEECYFNWLQFNGAVHYKPSRQGQTLARMKMTRLYGALPDGSIVHHINGDCFDNRKENLMLFESHADHIRWHRGNRDRVIPLYPPL